MVDWLTISQASGSGNATITITASTYSGLIDRATSLKVSTVSSAISKYVTVQQTAQQPFTASPSSISDGGLGGTYQIEITSSHEWTATTIPAWVTLSQNSGSAGTIITVSLPLNVGVQRTGSIVFTDVKGRTATVGLEQEEGSLNPPTSLYEIWYISSDGNIINPSEGDWGAELIGNTYNNYGVLTFDAPVRYIPENAFSGATELRKISVPSSLSRIEKKAFYYCTDLKEFNSPEDGNLWFVGFEAFCGDSGLTSVTLPKLGPSVIEGCAFEHTAISSFVFKESCWFIGGAAFHDCRSLSSVTFYNDYGNSMPYYPNNCSDSYFYCASNAFSAVTSGGTIHTPSGVTGVAIDDWTAFNDISYRTFSTYEIFPYWFRDVKMDYCRVFCFGHSAQTLSVGSGYNSTYGSEIDDGKVRQYVICADYDYNSGSTANVSLSYSSSTKTYARGRKPVVSGSTKTTVTSNEEYRVQLNGHRIVEITSVSKSPSGSRWKAEPWWVDKSYLLVTRISGSTGVNYATFTCTVSFDNGTETTYAVNFQP